MSDYDEVESIRASLGRVEALARYLDKLAPGDQHYAKLIRKALDGTAAIQENA